MCLVTAGLFGSAHLYGGYMNAGFFIKQKNLQLGVFIKLNELLNSNLLPAVDTVLAMLYWIQAM